MAADGVSPRDVVRPFAARVVRPDRAPGVVIPMPDPLDETAPTPHWQPDPTAYEDLDPGIYVYRQRVRGVDHVGLVCELDVTAFSDGRVRGHEQVDPARVEALERFHADHPAPPALVVLMHRPGEAYRRALAEALHAVPQLDFSGPDGARQTVWRVPPGAATTSVTDELSGTTHYVADGHHRIRAALRRHHADGEGLLCVLHALDGLRLSAFHRLVNGPVDPAHLVELLRPEFSTRSVDERPTPSPGTFGMRLNGRWSLLHYEGSREDGPAGLDAAVLHARVLDQLTAVAPTLRVTATRAPVDQLVALCDSDGGALFTLAPPALDTLTGLADRGALLPPKTTYFRPKPCAGIFLRPG